MPSKGIPDYVLYQEEIRPSIPAGVFLCELWRGLPTDLTFIEVALPGGLRARRALSRIDYVWVPPDTVIALEDNPQKLLYAMGRRTATYMDFFHVAAEKPRPISDLRQDIQEFNLRQIAKARKSQPPPPGTWIR